MGGCMVPHPLAMSSLTGTGLPAEIWLLILEDPLDRRIVAMVSRGDRDFVPRPKHDTPGRMILYAAISAGYLGLVQWLCQWWTLCSGDQEVCYHLAMRMGHPRIAHWFAGVYDIPVSLRRMTARRMRDNPSHYPIASLRDMIFPPRPVGFVRAIQASDTDESLQIRNLRVALDVAVADNEWSGRFTFFYAVQHRKWQAVDMIWDRLPIADREPALNRLFTGDGHEERHCALMEQYKTKLPTTIPSPGPNNSLAVTLWHMGVFRELERELDLDRLGARARSGRGTSYGRRLEEWFAPRDREPERDESDSGLG